MVKLKFSGYPKRCLVAAGLRDVACLVYSCIRFSQSRDIAVAATFAWTEGDKENLVFAHIDDRLQFGFELNFLLAI